MVFLLLFGTVPCPLHPPAHKPPPPPTHHVPSATSKQANKHSHSPFSPAFPSFATPITCLFLFSPMFPCQRQKNLLALGF